MSAAKSLSETQIAEIQSWADEGANLSDIQRRLAEEMDVKVTYMEMRFLMEDIGVSLLPDPPKKSLEPEPEPEEQPREEAPEADDDIESDGPQEFSEIPDQGDPETATADITVDELVRPGMIVSGKVTFDGGKTLGWYLDQFGRLGVDPGPDPDFRPSEAQLRVFQSELQKTLKEKGFG